MAYHRRVRHAFKPGATKPRRQRRGGAVDHATARAYWCAACRTRIAGEDAAISVAGAHRHHFVNPAGMAFEIGCFAEARCTVEGAATLADTWFAGFAWAYALCANCRAHLGWRYEGDGARFFGLILARLVGPI
jgi:hypothetical protein